MSMKVFNSQLRAFRWSYHHTMDRFEALLQNLELHFQSSFVRVLVVNS